MIEAGRLTDKVNILRRVLSKDKWGSEAIKYIKELTTRANVLVENGQMTERANEIYYTYNISVLCRKLRVAEYDVVEWRGDYYQVQSIVPTRERDGQYIKAIKIDSTLVVPALVRRYNVKFVERINAIDYVIAETVTNDDGTFSLATAPTHAQQKFEGWYTLPDGGGAEITEEYIATSDLRLYAHYIEYEHRYEAMLAMMPTAIRTALVSWYCPALQELTNELILTDGVLLDLSANEHDMQMLNFEGSTDSGIRPDGGLQFDGVDDWAVCTNVNELNAGEYTAIVEYANYDNDSQSSCMFGNGSGVESRRENYAYANTNGYFFIGAYNNETRNMGYATEITYPPASGTMIQTNEYCLIGGVRTELRGFDPQEPSPILSMGRKYAKTSHMRKFVLYSAILFNRQLNEIEIDWVNNNIIHYI